MKKKQVIKELRILSDLMKNLGASMAFYFDDEIKRHGCELNSYGFLAESWANAIKKTIEEDQSESVANETEKGTEND